MQLKLLHRSKEIENSMYHSQTQRYNAIVIFTISSFILIAIFYLHHILEIKVALAFLV